MKRSSSNKSRKVKKHKANNNNGASNLQQIRDDEDLARFLQNDENSRLPSASGASGASSHAPFSMALVTDNVRGDHRLLTALTNTPALAFSPLSILTTVPGTRLVRTPANVLVNRAPARSFPLSALMDDPAPASNVVTPMRWQRNGSNRNSGAGMAAVADGSDFLQFMSEFESFMTNHVPDERRAENKSRIDMLPVSQYKSPTISGSAAANDSKRHVVGDDEKDAKVQQTEPDNRKTCSICLEPFASNDRVMTLPCMHVFHADELARWLETNPTCPVCKHRAF